MPYVDPGEGEKMVLDLQDVRSTLEDVVAKSQIRLFGSSSRPLSVQAEAGPSRLGSESDASEVGSEEDYSDEDDEDAYSEDDGEFHSDDDFSDDDDQDVPEDDDAVLGDHGRTAPRTVRRSMQGFSTLGGNRGQVDYAESDSDLGGEDDDDPGSSRRFVRFDDDDVVDVPDVEEGEEGGGMCELAVDGFFEHGEEFGEGACDCCACALSRGRAEYGHDEVAECCGCGCGSTGLEGVNNEAGATEGGVATAGGVETAIVGGAGGENNDAECDGVNTDAAGLSAG